MDTSKLSRAKVGEPSTVSARSDIVPDLASVVICAYNNWPDLEMSIESALHQSYQPLEVIVIDNSSTDATSEEVPLRFGSRLQYIQQTNRRDAGAYNAGFAAARGEFIQFLDGDDVLAPNKIEKQVEVFRANPALDIVYGDIRHFQTFGGRADWEDLATQPEEDMLSALVLSQREWIGIVVLGTLFHRRALETVGEWDEKLYISDYDYWLRAAIAGCRFGHCPGSTMGFKRLRAGQMTSDVPAMIRGREALWDKALGYVTREPYRSLVAAKAARQKFLIAISRENKSTQDALRALELARAISPRTVPQFVYALAWTAIMFPGGLILANLQWLRPFRRLLTRLFRSKSYVTQT